MASIYQCTSNLYGEKIRKYKVKEDYPWNVYHFIVIILRVIKRTRITAGGHTGLLDLFYAVFLMTEMWRLKTRDPKIQCSHVVQTFMPLCKMVLVASFCCGSE